jgi:hypothetical protein
MSGMLQVELEATEGQREAALSVAPPSPQTFSAPELPTQQSSLVARSAGSAESPG